MAVYVKNKLLSSKTDELIIKGGESLMELVERTSLPPVLHDYLRVSIDGVVIPKENWMTTTASAKNVVYVAVVPQGGGDGGKNPLAAIAMVALAVFTMGAGAYGLAGLSGLTGTSLAVAQVGVMFVGMLAINALFPPPSTSRDSTTDSSAFFGMEGLRNRARPHGAVRNIYGEYKVAPDLGAEPYVITRGDTQTLYGLYDFGYGELEISNVLIGNTPIENYRGAVYKVHTNYTDGDLDHYQNDNVTESFSSEITTDWTERTCPSDESNEAHIDVQFPLGLARFPEGGGMATDEAKFHLQFRKSDLSTAWMGIGSLSHFHTSHTVTEGTATYAKRMYFDLTSLYTTVAGAGGYTQIKSNSSFTVKVRGTTVNTTLSSLVPYPLPLQVGQTFYLNGELYTINARVAGSTVIRYVYNPYTDIDATDDSYRETSYTITLDRALTAQPKNYNVYTYGCYLTTIIDYTFETCTWTWVSTYTGGLAVTLYKPEVYDEFYLTRAMSKPFVLSLNIGFPERTEWDIRIRRGDTVYYALSAGWDDKFADKTVLKAIQSVTYRQPMDFRVGHTVLELVIRATDQLSGIVDTLTAYTRRKLAYYTGSAWSTKYTSNPAWIALDILMGDANPDPIPESRIDLTSYKAWADFCDTASAQGDTKYECDCNWDGMSTVFERLISVMAAGRATPSMIENKYAVIYEQFPTTAVQMFTNKNSFGFKGSKVFTKQPHALTVSFIDPLAEWQMVDIQVYADGYDELTATYFEKITLPLCTRSDQAWRDGRYYLAQGQLRPESFTITTDIENLIAERGDLVTVQSDVARAGGIATRLTDVSSLPVVVLREPVIWNGTDTFNLRIRYDDGTQEEINVTGQTDPYTITLASSPAEIKAGDLCVYGEEDYVTDEFLIKSINPGSDLSAKLTLVPVARAIATSDSGTIPDYTPPINTEDYLYPVCLNAVAVETNFYFDQRFPYVDITVRWTNIPSNIEYSIWLCDDEYGNYDLIGTSDGTEDFKLFDRKSPLDADYYRDGSGYVKVIPKNIVGKKPVFDECQATVVLFPVDEDAPGKPLFFAGNINADTMNLSWLPPVDTDIAGYIIKYTNETTPDWDTATAQGNLIPYNITTANFNARIGSYMIKTLDTSGHLSSEMGLIKTAIPALLGFDNFTTVTEHTGFTGAKSNTELVSGGIRLIQDGDSYVDYGTYTFDTIVDLGDVYNSYISSSLARTIINSGSEDTLESDQDVIIQMRMSSDNPSISDWDATFGYLAAVDAAYGYLSGAGASDWSGWQNLYAGYYTGRHFEFRAVLVSNKSYITPHVYELEITVDMVERTDAQNNLSSVVNGSTITFNDEFKDIPSIAITQDNMTAGDYFQITNQATGGFDIEFFNVSDTSVIRQFDYVAVGYGILLATIDNPIEPGAEDDLALLPEAVSFITRQDLLT